MRPGGFNVGMGDGAVRFLPNTIDPKTIQGLATKSGRERTNLPR